MTKIWEKEFGKSDRFGMSFRLYRSYDPITSGTLLAAALHVVSPGVGDTKDVISEVEKWEARSEIEEEVCGGDWAEFNDGHSDVDDA